MGDGNGNAPYMSIREVMSEVRTEVKGLRKDFEDFKDTVVTKDEHNRTHNREITARRYFITTAVALLAILVGVITTLIAVVVTGGTI